MCVFVQSEFEVVIWFTNQCIITMTFLLPLSWGNSGSDSGRERGADLGFFRGHKNFNELSSIKLDCAIFGLTRFNTFA